MSGFILVLMKMIEKNGHLFFAPMYIGQVKVRWYFKVHKHGNEVVFLKMLCVTRA